MIRFVGVMTSLLVFLACWATVAAQQADDGGEIAFNNHCRECHSIKKGDNRLGPSLYGIFGAAAQKVEGYRNYSGGLQGITWDEAMLDKFITDPASVASSTNMQFPGVADAAERRKIIEYLRAHGTP